MDGFHDGRKTEKLQSVSTCLQKCSPQLESCFSLVGVGREFSIEGLKDVEIGNYLTS